MAKGGPGVVIVSSGGLPVTQVTGGGNAAPFTVVTGNGFPVTLVSSLGTAVALYNLDGTEYSSLTAPVLAFASATDPDSDNTQDFTADFFESIVGKVVRLVGTFGSATVSAPYDSDSSNTIDAGEDAALEATFTTGAIDDGVCSFKCRIEDGSGNALSDWSNTVSKTIDATAPTVTSSNAVNLAENSALSHTLTANESVTWTKTGGADAALFTLAGSNLSMTAKDYESPADADTNNTYVVQVTATDTAGNATNQTITVTVTDVVEKFYTFVGSDFSNSGATADHTASFDIGTATATRLVIVGILRQNARVPISIKVNGIDLSPVISTDAVTVAIWAGVVNSGSGSQSIVIDYATGTFENRSMHVWIADGLSSNTVKLTAVKNGAGTVNLGSVTAGDFAFAISNAGTTSLDGSDEAPDASRADSGPYASSFDWTISTTDASFTVNSTTGNVVVACWA